MLAVDQRVPREYSATKARESIAKIFPELDLKTVTSAALAEIARKLPELLSKKVRKDTASFYTAPWAADLLSELAVTGIEAKICDPACGAGNLLLSAVKSIRHRGNAKHTLQIFGSDINPAGAEVTRIILNTYLHEMPEVNSEIEVNIVEGDAFHVAPDGGRAS